MVGLTFAWSLRGRCAQGRALAERVHGAQDAPSPELAWATGFLALYAGDVEVGAALAAVAAQQAARAGDARTQGRALILVGMAALFVDPAAAEPVLARAAELADLAGDEWGEVEALQVLAYCHLYRSDHQAAVECADRARPALDRLGHGQLQAWDDAIRAEAATQSGRFEDAERAGRAGLELALSVEEPVSAAGALLPLVRALVHVDRVGEALALVEEVRPFFDVHTGLGTSMLLDLAAAVAACWSDPAKAHGALDHAQQAAAGGGVAVAAAEAGLLLTASRSIRGDVDGAVAAATESARWATAVGNREFAGAAALAACAARRAAGGAGSDQPYTALVELARLGLLPHAADGLDVVAGLVLDRGRPAVTARLHAASTRLRGELGTTPSPLIRQLRRADERAVAERLPPDELVSAHTEGSRLDLAQAVAYACRSRGRRARPVSGWDSLTPTETEVVRLAADGLANRAIAEQLLIAPGTVRTHLRSIFGKLSVINRAQLAARAAGHLQG